MTKQHFFAVIGWPIAHSKSPELYQSFATAHNIAIDYRKIAIEPGCFAKDIRALIQQGLLGFNITMPFKQEAFALCDVVDAAAKQAKAVNTVIVKDNKLYGFNTDGAGFKRHLQKLAWALQNKTVLILGAGGAVQNILPSLLELDVKEIVLANRTTAKAELLAKQYPAVSVIPWQEMNTIQPGLVIQATSSKTLDLPEMDLSDCYCYDLQYYDDLPFLTWAKSHHAKAVSDGYGMLLGQAEINFEWYLSLIT